MIKKLLFLSSFILILDLSSYAQSCIPDPQYTNTTTQNGIYPDTLIDFDTAYVGVPYTQLVTIVVPPDTQALPPPFPAIAWDSTRLDSVTGLPASMSFACWNNNGSGNMNRCMWKGNSIGCAIISGTPTAGEAGVHLLKFYTNNFVGGQTIANSYVITTYKIVVAPASNGINENPRIQLVMQNNPNPMVDRTEIQFAADDNGYANFKIYNIIGTIIQQDEIFVHKGINKIELNARDFDSGIYFYSLSHGSNAFTRKMIVNK
jgi:hypothetical protein